MPVLRRHITRVLILLFFIAQSSCAYQTAHRADYSYTEEPGYGKVAVISAEFVPIVAFEGYASGKGEGTGKGAGAATGAWIKGALEGVATSGDPFAAVLGMFVMIIMVPVVLVGGGVYGAVTAEPKKRIKKYEAALNDSLKALRIQENVRDNAYAIINEYTSIEATVVTEGGPKTYPPAITQSKKPKTVKKLNVDDIGKPYVEVEVEPEDTGGISGTAPDKASDYTYLKDRGIDTVLELSVVNFGITGKELGVNEPVGFYMTMQTKLIRTSDNAQRYIFNSVYYSAKRKIAVWGEDDAAAFRKELDKAFFHLADDAVVKAFMLRDIPWIRAGAYLERYNKKAQGKIMKDLTK